MPLPDSAREWLFANGFPAVVGRGADLPITAVPLWMATSPSSVTGMLERYQTWLAVPKAAPAGACATQHLSGRVAALLIGVWVFSGRLVEPSRGGVWVEIDQHGRTLRAWADDQTKAFPTGPEQVVPVLVQSVAPMLNSAMEQTHITAKLAWGGVATGVAGSVLRAVKACPQRREELLGAAAGMLASDAWPVASPLVTLTGDGCGQRRHTCCLIFQSPSHKECQSCPRLARAGRAPHSW